LSSNFDPSGAAPVIHELIISPILEKVLDSASSSLAKLNSASDPKDIKGHVVTMYAALIQNFKQGLLVVGQPLLEQSEMDGLWHTSGKTSGIEKEISMNTGSRSARRANLISELKKRGIDPDDALLDEVRTKRLYQGKAQRRKILEFQKLHRYSTFLAESPA
jgi:hypothetical protein